MGIFAKTVDTYNHADVTELVGVSESAILEFKSKVDKDDDLLKELVAFANTFGGYLVIGAEDRNGKLHALPGVPNIDGFQQKIIDLCLTRVVPPIVPYPSPPILVPGSKNVLSYPSRPLVELPRLATTADTARVRARGVSYPLGDAQPLHESVAYTPHPERPQEFFIEMTIYGSTFVGIDLRRKIEGAVRVPLLDFLGSLLLWLVFGKRFLGSHGYQGPVLVSAALRGIRGQNFIWRVETSFSDPYGRTPLFDDDVSTEVETSTAELADNLKSVALNLFLPLAYACGFESLLTENRDDVIGRGVEYLGWSLADIVANR